MRKRIKIISVVFTLLMLISSLSTTVFAIDWDGSSADTGSGGRPADVNGYALRVYPGDNCVGYRFSCVDEDGYNRVSKVIDVFRNNYYGNYSCDYDYKFDWKCSKCQLIDNQYGSFSTSRNSYNCYKEANMGFATSLGTPDTMEAWQNVEKNLNIILTKLGVGTIEDLEGGDKVLVEPIYEIKLQTIYHALTTTEACVYGAAMLGMDSDGGASSTAASWGFISVGPNRVYPNHLYTPDGQGLWPAATLLTKRGTFRTIINKGYGVGIAYTQDEEEEDSIVYTDAEISEITIRNKNGGILDNKDLEIGDTVYVYYTYKNNTSEAIQVDGYDDDGTRINSSNSYYNIPAYSSILVKGGAITVPDEENFSVWGGVYLHGMPKGDTSLEYDGTNNELTLDCATACPLYLVPITPNASYREETTVITSYWLKNKSSRNFTQSKKVSAEFTVRAADGAVITEDYISSLVVPGSDQNLVYFKWEVPDGLNNTNVKIDATLYVNGDEVFNTFQKYSTIPYTVYSTPDTQYKRSAPSGFTVPNTPTNSTQYASWWVYTYSGGKFTKNEYCVGINGTQTITPATGETDYVSSGQYVMKSGYGISILASPSVFNVSGYTAATSSMFTGPQYVTAMFPEFSYKATANKCRTLLKSGSKWTFRANGDYGNVHFTPLYFPDGGYTVTVKYSDVWTPAGMISVTRKTNTIKIEGSAYDDWYIGR